MGSLPQYRAVRSTATSRRALRLRLRPPPGLGPPFANRPSAREGYVARRVSAPRFLLFSLFPVFLVLRVLPSALTARGVEYATARFAFSAFARLSRLFSVLDPMSAHLALMFAQTPCEAYELRLPSSQVIFTRPRRRCVLVLSCSTLVFFCLAKL